MKKVKLMDEKKIIPKDKLVDLVLNACKEAKLPTAQAYERSDDGYSTHAYVAIREDRFKKQPFGSSNHTYDIAYIIQMNAGEVSYGKIPHVNGSKRKIVIFRDNTFGFTDESVLINVQNFDLERFNDFRKALEKRGLRPQCELHNRGLIFPGEMLEPYSKDPKPEQPRYVSSNTKKAA